MPNKLDLGEDEAIIEVTMNGVDFHVDAFDAAENIGHLAALHRSAPALCLNCSSQFTLEIDPKTRETPDGNMLVCPKCDSTQTRAPIEVDQAVSEWLVERFNLPHCSLRAARKFQNYVDDVCRQVKKNGSPSPESPTSTASTPEEPPTSAWGPLT